MADDLTLVEAARQGDRGAFDDLVIKYRNKMLRYAENITRNRDDAEEAAQETFIRAYMHLDSFRGDSRFHTWLTRITINQSLIKLRTRRTNVLPLDRPAGEGDTLTYQIENQAPNPEEMCAQREIREILDCELRKLKPAFRAVLQLRAFEESSVEQTAARLGISIGAVKTASRRARIKLRSRLGRRRAAVA